MPSDKVKIEGLSNLKRAMKATREVVGGRALMNKLVTEVGAMAANVMQDAQEKAPIDEGTLRGEARSTATITPTAEIAASVTFGGLATAYARRQHEEKDWIHPKGGDDHFLYGESYSAWNDTRAAEYARALDREAGRIADRHIQDAAGGAI